MLNIVPKILPSWGLQIAPEKIQRDSLNYLIFRLSKHRIQPQRTEIRRDRLYTRNDFQNLLDGINWFWPTIELTTQELRNLFQILQGDSDLNSPRHLTAESQRELTQVEQKLQDAYIDQLHQLQLNIF